MSRSESIPVSVVPLRKIFGPDRIYRAGPAVELCIIVAVIVLFNAYPDRIGIYATATDSRTFVPLLASGFQVHMPWLNAYWSLALTLAAAKFALGRWTPALRWADWGLKLLLCYLLFRLIVGGPIIGLAPGWVATPGTFGSWFDESKVPALNALIKGVFSLTIFALLLSALKQLLSVVRWIERNPVERGQK